MFSAVFIKLRKFLIVDIVHTENADDTEVRRRTLWGNVNCSELTVNERKWVRKRTMEGNIF